MKDLFQDYELQREELLARIAQSLQLDDTRKRRMEDAYKSISSLLDKDEFYFKQAEIDVYPQGSTAIGTTVKPLKGNEFDLDIVVHVKRLYNFYTPQEIYTALLKILEADLRYTDKIVKKNRCVRLNYTGDFHMDILPGCIVSVFDDKNLKVPDRELRTFTSSNPRGLAEWFLTVASSVKMPLLKSFHNELKLRATVDDLPDNDFYEKTPLQRSVQLMKRYRDIFFETNPDYQTSSIVLTTIMARYYQGEGSIYQTIENIINRIKSAYNNALILKTKFKVLNPVNDEEDFTDKWSNKHYQYFYDFLNDFEYKWKQLRLGFEKSNEDYIKLFGEGVYKQSLHAQLRQMSKYSDDQISKANGSILADKAFTDNWGRINESKGNRNEPHRNFGERHSGQL